MEVPNAAAGIARRGFDEPRPILNDEKTLTQNIQIIKKNSRNIRIFSV